MKRSSIFLAGATVVLAISAVFATKANKHFAAISTGYLPSSEGFIQNAAVGSLLTNTVGTHVKAYVELCTVAGTKESTPVELLTVNGGATIYIH
jgi:hypothetical protein